jgi:hypothetical protein
MSDDAPRTDEVLLVDAGADDDLDIGDLGETAFLHWVARARLVAQPVRRDRTGWDCLVEVPSAVDQPIDCKVQVKASITAAAAASIKLDNFVRMANAALPWFVAGLQFEETEEDIELRRMHLVHVDEALVQRVNEEVARLPPGTELHKKRISLRWTTDNELLPPTGKVLRARLLSHVGTDPWEYLERKRRWLSASKLKNQVTRTIFTPSDPSAYYLLAAQLLTGEIERFALSSQDLARIPVPTGAEAIAGFATLATPLTPSTMDVLLESGTDRVLLRCQMYSSAALTTLPEENHRARLVDTFLAITLHRGGVGVKIEIPPRRVPLRDAGRAAKALRLLGSGQCALTLDATSEPSEPISVGVFEEGDKDLLADVLSFENALWICERCSLDVERECDLGVVAAQKERIAFMRTLMEDGVGFNLDVGLSEEDRPNIKEGNGAILFLPYILVGDLVAYAAVALLGDFQLSSHSHELSLKAPRVRVLSSSFETKERWISEQRWESLIADSSERLKKDGISQIVEMQIDASITMMFTGAEPKPIVSE